MLLLISVMSSLCRAEHIGRDRFEYPDGPIAGSAGGGLWDWDNVVGAHGGVRSDWDVATGTPVVEGRVLVTLNAGAFREYNGPGEGLPDTTDEGRGAINSGNLSRKVYFRVTLTRAPGAESSLISSLDFGEPRVDFGVLPGPGPRRFGVAAPEFGTNVSAITPVDGQVYVLVGKLDYAGDRIALYVNPDLNQPEPASAAAGFVYLGTHWSTAARLSGTGGGASRWDDLRVATTWEELRDPVIVTTLADEDDGVLATGADARNSLREAVRYAPSGAYIEISPAFVDVLTLETLGGLPPMSLSRGQLTITRPCVIDGSSRPGMSISGGGTTRILETRVPGVVITDLSFTRGSSADLGGAILSTQNSGLTLNRCTLFGNRAQVEGGAVYHNGSSGLRLNHCTLTGNEAGTDGGAVYCPAGTVLLQHCTITGNTAGRRGGGVSNEGFVSVHQTIVAGNDAPGAPDFFQRGGSLTTSGVNLIGVNETVQDRFPEGPRAGTFNNRLDPRLAPLGYYGGPTPTHPPMAGSPAVDASAAPGPRGTDQRGLPRLSGSALDIGAVETASVLVENLSPDGPGSLRQALADAPAHALIEFLPALSGRSLALGSELVVSKPLTLSALGLPGGLILHAGADARILLLQSSAAGVNLQGLTFTGGRSQSPGGAILNEGDLTVMRCTFYGNQGTAGGAIFSRGRSSLASLRVFHSTLVDNAAFTGGALAGRSVRALLSHVTIVGNRILPSLVFPLDGVGAGINSRGSDALLHNSIVAGNLAPEGGNFDGQLLSSGLNLVGEEPLGANPATYRVVSDPRLYPLGYFGGPTPTLHPLPDSPAIDAVETGLTTQTDQRGLRRRINGRDDIGAVEAGPVRMVANLNDSGPGSLRQALADAGSSPGSQVRFESGLSGQTIQLTSGQLSVSGPVLIDGSFLAERPVVRAASGSRVFSVTGPSASGVFLDSIRLAGGRAEGEFDAGGGIRNVSGIVSLLRVEVFDCRAAICGGVYNNSGRLELIDSVVQGNSSASGGGGIYNFDGQVRAVRTRIGGNSAVGGGGGIYSVTGAGASGLVLENCTVDGNRAAQGGGIFATASGRAAVLLQCSLALNTASKAGGGLYCAEGSLELVRSTISGNSAPLDAGSGIVLGEQFGAEVAISGCIIAGNTGSDLDRLQPAVGNGFRSLGYNLVGTGNASSLFAGTGDQRGVVDPGLLPLAFYGGLTPTLLPAPGSRAIDAGQPTDPGGNDQRGFARKVGAAVDAGAVEAVSGPILGHLAVRQTDNRVEARFDLVDPLSATLEVVFEHSIDGGLSWTRSQQATGDLGSAVAQGGRRTVVWNVLQELGPVLKSQVRVRLSATSLQGATTSAISQNLLVDTRPRTVTLRGRVVTSQGGPVSGARVQFESAPAVNTDSTGRYFISNVPRGGGTLRVQRTTFSPQTRLIEPISGILEHVVEDFVMVPLAFQVTALTPDVQGSYLAGNIPFEIQVTATIDWGQREKGRVEFLLGNELLATVNNVTGDTVTIRMNTANRTRTQLPYEAIPLRAVAVAGGTGERSQAATHVLEFVRAGWLESLNGTTTQLAGFDPRYSFAATWPPELPPVLDLAAGQLFDIGIDLGVSLGMMYAPRSGEWELWLGDPGNVRSSWRPRDWDEEQGGFKIGGESLALETRAFASGRASRLGLGFRELLVDTTLSYNQRLGELCLTDFIPATSASIRRLGTVADAVGYDINSLQCIRFDLDISGNLRGNARADSGPLRFDDAAFTATGALSGYYKPELGPIANVIAKLSGSVAVTLGVPRFEYRNTTLRVVAEVGVEPGLSFLRSLSYGPNTWVLVNKRFPSPPPAPGLAETEVSEGIQALRVITSRILDGMPVTGPADQFVANKTQGSGVMLADLGEPPSPAVQTNTVIMQNVSRRTAHALASRGNQLLLVYTRAVSGGSVDLVWSRYDGTTWSAPAAIPGTSTSEIAQLALRFDGAGAAVLIWQQLRSIPAGGALESEFAQALEIRHARWLNGTWSTPGFLTSNSLYDGEPQLVGPMADGDLLAIWRSAAYGPGWATSGTLNSRRWDSTTRAWETPVAFATDSRGGVDFSSAGGGTTAVAVWSVDLDGQPVTPWDSELFRSTWVNGVWGAPERLTFDGVSDRSPRVGMDGSGTVFLAWARENRLAFAQDLEELTLVDISPNPLGIRDLRLAASSAGRVAVFWQETLLQGGDSQYSIYDKTLRAWAKPRALWQDRDAEYQLDPLWDSSDRVTVAILKDRLVSVTKEFTAEDEFGRLVPVTISNVTERASTDLVLTRRIIGANLSVRAKDLRVSEDLWIPGNTVSITAKLRNTGDVALPGPGIGFYFVSPGQPDRVIGVIGLAETLGAGFASEVTVSWTLPESLPPGRLVVRADPSREVAEFDESPQDNEASLPRGGVDLAVAFKSRNQYPDGSVRVVATVMNAGSPASAASTLELKREDGTRLSTVAVRAISPAASVDVVLDLPPGTHQSLMETYSLSIDPVSVADIDASNNRSGFTLYSFPPALPGRTAILEPSGMDLGSIPLADGLVLGQFQLRNSGASALTVFSISTPAGANLDWASGILAAGETRTIQIALPVQSVGVLQWTSLVKSDATQGADPTGTTSLNFRVQVLAPLPPSNSRLAARFPLDVNGNSADGRFVASRVRNVTFSPAGATATSGGAALFNGVDSGIQHPWNALLNPGTANTSDSLTITVWVKSTGGNGNYESVFTSRHDRAPDSDGFVLYDGPGGGWEFWTGNGVAEGNWQILGGPPVTLNAWRHVALVYDAVLNRKRLFVDGVLAGQEETRVSPNRVQPLNIGAGGDLGDSFFFKGWLDDLAIFHGALTSAELLKVRAGDYSSFPTARGPDPVTLRGFRVYVEQGQLRAAVTFDRDSSFSYIVERSENLVDWRFLRTIPAGGGPAGVAPLEVNGLPADQTRIFYRLLTAR